MQTPTVSDPVTVHSGFFDLVEVEVKYTDGLNTHKRLIVRNKGAVGIVLYREDIDSVVLIKQFRIPTSLVMEPVLLEIPAGLVDEGESPEEAAQREGFEETGYDLKDKPEHLLSFYSSPGYSTEKLDLFWAKVDSTHKLTLGGGLSVENELIDVIYMTIAQIQDLLKSNLRNFDGKTYIALSAFLRKLGK